MKDDTIKLLYGITAICAFIVLFYIGGLYESGKITVLNFLIRFAADIIAFVWSCYQAGAFDYGNGQDND